MRTILLLATATIALAGCNKKSVSLDNATPEEVAKATKDAGLSIKPGQWETSIEVLEVEAPGLPKEAIGMMKSNASQTHSYCITPEEAANPSGGLFTDDTKNTKCKVEHFAMSGGRVDQTIVCPGPGGKNGMRMTTSGTYSAESMTGTADMDMGDTMKMKAKLTSKRVGECKPGEK